MGVTNYFLRGMILQAVEGQVVCPDFCTLKRRSIDLRLHWFLVGPQIVLRWYVSQIYYMHLLHVHPLFSWGKTAILTDLFWVEMPLAKRNMRKCRSCRLKERMCDANTKTADSFSKIRVLAAGVIKLPILGESNNTHVWSFWGISLNALLGLAI